jgi:hypothetical protein
MTRRCAKLAQGRLTLMARDIGSHRGAETRRVALANLKKSKNDLPEMQKSDSGEARDNPSRSPTAVKLQVAKCTSVG